MECPVCFDPLGEPPRYRYRTTCDHDVCVLCVASIVEANPNAACPLCREPGLELISDAAQYGAVMRAFGKIPRFFRTRERCMLATASVVLQMVAAVPFAPSTSRVVASALIGHALVCLAAGALAMAVDDPVVCWYLAHVAWLDFGVGEMFMVALFEVKFQVVMWLAGIAAHWVAWCVLA